MCAIHKCRLLIVKKNYDMTTLSNEDNDEITELTSLLRQGYITLYLRKSPWQTSSPSGLKASTAFFPKKATRYSYMQFVLPAGHGS